MNTRDTFRTVDGGDVPIEVNTRRMSQDRFIDNSRLGSHEEWQPSSDPKKPGGNIIHSPNSVEANVKRSMGALKSRSSFKNESSDEVPCGPGGCYITGGW